MGSWSAIYAGPTTTDKRRCEQKRYSTYMVSGSLNFLKAGWRVSGPARRADPAGRPGSGDGKESGMFSHMWWHYGLMTFYFPYLLKGAEAQLLGRFGTIHEAGEAALFLAAEATFTTGTNLNLTGGAELNMGMKSRQKGSNYTIF